MSSSTRTLLTAVIVALAAGFAAGWFAGRASKKTPQERFDRAAEEFRQGLFGK
jgi:hypothetical protein